MNGLKTTIYRRSKDLPEVEGGNFFHSKQLFEILAKTPRQKPYMVVVEDAQGRIVSHMLGFLRYRTFIFPPFLLVHCRVLGEGEYAESEYPKDELFGEMLKALTQELNSRTLYIEISHLSQKMLGYRQLKQMGYYPINWMSIHNSLHSHAPEERITDKLQKRIDAAHERGVKTEVVCTEEDFKAFSRLLRRHNILKPKRYIPDDVFFRQMMDGNNARLFVTKYHGKVDAYDRGYQHMNFMDVGLPFSKNPFREFILRFGGKEQSTYRWFRFSIKWVNKLLAWIYRE